MADDDHTKPDCLFLVDSGCSFTLVLLWKVTGHSVFISMVFLGELPVRQCYIFHQRFMRREPVFII